jgi:CHAT domain-containing protein
LVDQSGVPQNGFLSVRDIYNLRLPVDLVVLSACQTGLGKDVRGEGIISLARGFLAAGARRVLVSLWKVDDEATAEFMRQFYCAMLTGERLAPAAALRAVQAAMLTSARWRLPFYWSGFVLQGDWR